MFRRRKKYEQLYVVIVTVQTEDGIGSGQCVVGPMAEEVANDFASLADEMVSADWGETLNALRVGVHFTPMPVLYPTTGGDWTRQRIESIVAMEDIRSLAPEHDHGRHGDGDVRDATPWERPRRNHPSEWGRKSYKPTAGDDDDQ